MLVKLKLTAMAVLILFLAAQMQGQNLTQTVKGTVGDKMIRQPLPGATVVLLNQQNQVIQGTTTDMDGRFKLTKVPVGNQKLKVTFLGYKELNLPNVQVISGKELDLNLELEENLIMAAEAVITAQVDKQKPLNELSAVSTRTFSVEESQRFAAAVNDPARMASSFAGVAVGNDGGNQIVIRGNAPNSMIWRMEGVDIPNPNHFSAQGSSGGGISILSAQVLSNSDFSTGAMTSEYGNALSGVFDMRLRKGNTDKREHTAQIGVLGLDIATEGPLKLGEKTGSYLVNYRYSTLGILADLGLDLNGGVTKFQDLSFNVYLPTSRVGTFTMFGIGGLSNQKNTGKPDSTKWSNEFFSKFRFGGAANTGVIGLTHQYVAGSKWHFKSVLAASGTRNQEQIFEFQLPDYAQREITNERHDNTKITLSSTVSYKWSPRHFLRAGAYVNALGYGLNQQTWQASREALITEVDAKGSTETGNAFAQYQYRPTERLTTSVGLHAFALRLNNSVSLEPRAAVRYQINERGNLTFGYGLHSQMQPLGVYFAGNPERSGYNKDLGFSKAHHFVLGYDQMLNKHTRFKTEVYYQALNQIPVQADSATSFSIINLLQDFPSIPLANTGLGRNYGLEITLERFLSKGFYYLLASSLYDSEYRASDQQWRNTQFNLGYVNSLVAGKEWTWNRKQKNRTFSANIKLTQMGGLREAPLDLEASRQRGESVYDLTQAYSVQLPSYFRLDTGVRIKRNYAHMTTTLALDVQNATNRQNIFSRYYDPYAKEVKTFTQAPRIPILSYKLEF